MNEAAEAQGQDNGQESADSKEVRQRSTIGFPYTDMDSAIDVAKAIFANVGTSTCSAAAQLAPWMRQSAKSSGFRTQIAAARLFGLIDSDDSESYRLTDLGRRIVDATQARAAKVDSFLSVPLFKALYEKYKVGSIPPAAALEREIVLLGVSEKQKARARQVFESSADQAGYKEHGPNRLVMPGVVPGADTPPPARKNGGGSNGGSDGDLPLDSLLLALLRKIPEQGQQWPAEKRLRWFRTFAMNVSQVYDDDDKPVELAIELRSEKAEGGNA